MMMNNSNRPVFGAISVPSTPRGPTSKKSDSNADTKPVASPRLGPISTESGTLSFSLEPGRAISIPKEKKTSETKAVAKFPSFGSSINTTPTNSNNPITPDVSNNPNNLEALAAETAANYSSTMTNQRLRPCSFSQVPPCSGPRGMDDLGTGKAAQPKRSNPFVSHTNGFSFQPNVCIDSNSIGKDNELDEIQRAPLPFGRAASITTVTPEPNLFVQPSSNDAPPAKRSKTAHSIVAQLPANEFTKKLDLFRGPEVCIRIGRPNGLCLKSYQLPKRLLIQASPYFEKAIKVERLGQCSQEVIELDCSKLAFDLVVQFLYTGTFVREKVIPDYVSQQISILMELCELAEQLNLDILDMALENIKQLLVEDYRGLQAEHIRKAVKLPTGHGLRILFARSCIHAYLESFAHAPQRTFCFRKELDELDGFAADLMRVYGEVAANRMSAREVNNNAVDLFKATDLLDGKTFYC